MKRLSRHFNCYAKEPRVMAIHTGLSVTVAGHLIRLDRHEEDKVAVVVVEQLNGAAGAVQLPAIKAAADLLAGRARRFLGSEWNVVDWKPPQQLRAAGA